ncbi:carboxypeptidase-like regulatory domain-containing protein [Granulicella sp. 5B5]|uniref:carboxypeptidase-like regulatory domain-containing protein n=1 Tax=Granulicella sp. 5B5 TaxID=1617967 RepID=UPI0015F73674|nr:carboxypeptidase-like regulatory domain-containing protein [Granulicella sp. 5B5]
MTNKTASTTLALGILMLGMSAAALAQSTNGTLRGTVLDPSGALIPQAQVTVTSAAGYTRTLTSDGTGNFQLAHLAPGSYSVSINAIGFTPALESVHVTGNKVASEQIKLGISVSQQIEVSANDALAENDVNAPADAR